MLPYELYYNFCVAITILKPNDIKTKLNLHVCNNRFYLFLEKCGRSGSCTAHNDRVPLEDQLAPLSPLAMPPGLSAQVFVTPTLQTRS